MKNRAWDDINAELNSIETLSRLFDLWSDAHVTQSVYNCTQETIPKRTVKGVEEHISIESFTKDGPLDKDAERISILFILKESNTGKNNDGLYCANGNFWFSDYLHDELFNGSMRFKDKKDYRDFINYRDKIGACVNVINPAFSWKKDYSKVAYMNINKRGGFGSTDQKTLNNYVQMYAPFIKKQIEILRPEIIVIMGIDTFISLTRTTKNHICVLLPDSGVKIDNVEHPENKAAIRRHFRYIETSIPETIKDNEYLAKVISTYHPAATYGINSIFGDAEEYEKFFRKVWKKATGKT